ncbi:PREDICTED: uncharacterized protein LOC105555669 [Vollenhovia emeryi]|uniref:uncharacterized protein LOC105555669 n=1 Tax=Vollenhovia emeryi TaxID=411798 RepID=UPI0005F4699D|nr:PREDICTED: uncharacterized protein LOC105555669 [Vollenhovia emeryi]
MDKKPTVVLRRIEEGAQASAKENEAMQTDCPPGQREGRTKAGPSSVDAPRSREKDTAPRYVDSLEDTDTEVEADAEDFEEPEERRGRPPTTGKGLFMKERKEAKKEVKRLKAQQKALRSVLDRRVLPNSRDRRGITPERVTARQMADMSVEQIAAELTEYIDIVDKVADTSKNLKGTYVHLLRNSACKIRAATTVLAGKQSPTTGEENSELSRLRERNKELEGQVAQLAVALLQQQQQQRPSEEEPKQAERPLRKRKLRRLAESSEDEGTDPPRTTRVSDDTTQECAGAGAADDKAVAAAEEDPPVLRPAVRGAKKRLEGPSEERALEEVRRVMESISLRSVRSGDAQEIRCCTAKEGRSTVPSQAPKKATGTKKKETSKPTPVTGGSTGQGKGDATNKEVARKRAASQTRPGKGATAQRTASRTRAAQPRDTRSEEGPTTSKGKTSKPTQATQGSWVEVVKRGLKKRTAPAQNGPSQRNEASTPATSGKKTPTAKCRNPRAQAVTLTFPPGMYAEGMRIIKSQIQLEDLGISEVRPRRALTGALILEVLGEDAKVKADQLADKIKVVVGDTEGVKVARPTKLAELRVKDLDDSATQEEVKEAVAKVGGCEPHEVKVGPLRRATNGLSTAWAQCPLAAAKQAAKSGRIKIGWVSARVDLLDARPLVCYRCLERGHVRQQCRSAQDRSNLCYRCGGEGHKAQACSATPKCPVCSAKGLPAGHKAGGGGCRLPPKKEARRMGAERRTQSQPAPVARATQEAEQNNQREEADMEVESSQVPAAIHTTEGAWRKPTLRPRNAHKNLADHGGAWLLSGGDCGTSKRPGPSVLGREFRWKGGNLLEEGGGQAYPHH